MRKVLVFNLVTLDGYFEGPNRDISWYYVTSGTGMDAEFNEYAIEMLKGIKSRLDLKLPTTRTFRNGNVLLYYQPAGKEK